MNANEKKFQYNGTALGSFEFVGTKAEFEKMLSDLRAVAPEFTGEIEQHDDYLYYEDARIATAL